MNAIGLTPVIQRPNEDVVVGEEILFRVGLRCSTQVDARVLCEKDCRLAITAPDGSVSIHERNASSYDGPSMISSLIHRECLNDLVDCITDGIYDVRFICDDLEADAQICIGAHGSAPVVVATFPDPIDVVPGRPFAVRFEITNRAETPVRIVAPDSCYAASVVGFVSAEEPPLWSRLSRASVHDEARGLYKHATIAPGTLDQLTSIALQHGDRYRFAVTFESVFRPGTEKRWMPREQLDMTVGFVLHTFDSRDARQVRWLKRTRANYHLDGALRSVGDARCRPWEWVSITPSD